MAINYGFNPEGGSLNFTFNTHDSHSLLFEDITLVKTGKRVKDGFFLRAESFYNVASYLDGIVGDSYMDLSEYGDRSLHEQSHGESFYNVIANRFRGKGLYILDEPEAALSPQRQLALMVILEELIQDGSQFLIVTHSPILLAMRNSIIYSFDNDYISEIKYEETEPYKITKMFIENKDNILDKLFNK
ncbi:MAG: AAA family ATPase [Coprobacillaceae bacterium]